MADPDQSRVIEPHPVLTRFYREGPGRVPFVRRLFNETAPHYDGLNQLLSLGSGAWYRRRCLLRAGLGPGMRVIDVAIGTGLLASEAVAITGGAEHVVGVDLSEAMLAEARRKLGVALVQGLAEALPLQEGCADFVTMGYALRHVGDLVGALREYRRVLRPGGTALLLEIGTPANPLRRKVVSLYLARIVPFLYRLARGGQTRRLMEYYWETIEHCVPAETILDAMGRAGFAAIECQTELDIFRSYVGRKPD